MIHPVRPFGKGRDTPVVIALCRYCRSKKDSAIVVASRYDTHRSQRRVSKSEEKKEHRQTVRLRARQVAQSKGVSMLRLSRTADVSYKVIKAVWDDPFYDIKLQTLGRLAEALGVPVAALIEDVPPAVEEQEKE